MEIPPYDQLMLPLFKALKGLGGSASIAEIDEYVGEHSGLPAELLDLPHNAEKAIKLSSSTDLLGHELTSKRQA